LLAAVRFQVAEPLPRGRRGYTPESLGLQVGGFGAAPAGVRAPLMRPRTTVVIATRNRRDALAATLERLLELPERPPLIVVDNGSDDGSAAAVRGRFPQVELVELRGNAGAAGRNDGARLARTPYLAFSDDDSWWRPGALAHAADLLDHHPRLGLVAGHVLVGPDGRDDPTCALMARSPLSGDPTLPGLPVLGFIACGTVVRRSSFLAAGGFHPALLTGGEEEPLELAACRWALRDVPEVVALHHPSPSRDAAARRRVMTRNALWSAWLRRRPAGALRRTLALARAAVADAAARDGALDALRGLPWVLHERRAVPRGLEEAAALLDAPHPPRTARNGYESPAALSTPPAWTSAASSVL
jgi:GT2 family glycosyltransferase